MAETHARLEAPLPGIGHRFPIQTELLIERVDDADVADRTVGHYDRLELDQSLNASAHRLAGVVRFRFVNQLRRGDAVAFAKRSATETTAKSFPETRSGSRSDATAGACTSASASRGSL